jgi:hypothetical protein
MEFGVVYALGDDRGRDGVHPTYNRARIIDKNAKLYSYSARATHVKVILVDENGKDLRHPKSHYIEELQDKPIEKLVRPSEILDLQETLAEFERRKKAEEDAERRRELRLKTQDEVMRQVAEKLQASADDIYVSLNFKDPDSDKFEVNSVRLSNGAAETFVQFCNYFKFVDMDIPDDDGGDDE